MFFIKFLGKIENVLGVASNIFNFTLEFNEKHFNPHFYVVKNEINSRNFFGRVTYSGNSYFEICTLFSATRTFEFSPQNHPKNSILQLHRPFFRMLKTKFLEQFAIPKIFRIANCSKKKKLKDLEKESGAARARTHGRGSVPLMSEVGCYTITPRGLDTSTVFNYKI